MKNAKRVLVYRTAPIGYGPRIFVKYADVETLDASLKPLTTWGGSDKNTGKAMGYEFPSGTPNRFLAAIEACVRAGFTIIEATPGTTKEFWS